MAETKTLFLEEKVNVKDVIPMQSERCHYHKTENWDKRYKIHHKQLKFNWATAGRKVHRSFPAARRVSTEI